MVWLGAGVLLLIALQSALFFIFPEPHAVLGSVALPESSRTLSSFVLSIATFLATFVLFRAWIGPRDQKAEGLLSYIFLSLAIVSLVALSHWFYDTGKLFCVFEPEHVFTSVRARWPFVNSNHLGHFLLPGFFLVVAALSVTLTELRDIAVTTQRSNKRSWGLLFSSHRVQQRLIRVGLLLGLALASALSIGATLSRGSWLAMSLGLILFVFRDWVFGRDTLPATSWDDRPERSGANDEDSSSSSTSRDQAFARESPKSKQRGKKTHISRDQISQTFARISFYGRPILVLSASVLLYFFMYGKGSELFAERLEYGLMHSQDDMRWQLYRDTMPLIREHFWFGVGAGAWAKIHPQYMSAALSGVNPVYLHSDPLQFLAELGVVTSSVVLAGFLLLVLRAVKTARRTKGRDRAALCGLVCGGLALFIASFLDFPFRIPAITTLAAATLALTTFYIDKHASSEI